MSTVPVVEACANCGAPLDLDEAGACRWCRARIRVRPAVRPVLRFQDDIDLVPYDLDDCATSSPFLSLTLSTFGLLSAQPVVKEYLRREPGLLAQLRALCAAVSAGGVRVRDEGLLKDSFDTNLGVYTPEEIWTFDLAFDALAQCGLLDGLTSPVRAMIASNVQSLDWYSRKHLWKKAMKAAVDGPAAFHQLRAQTPRRPV